MSSDVQQRIVRLSGAIILMFLLLIGWQTYWQLYKSDWLLAQPTNHRMARVESSTLRGTIYDCRNARLAWSEQGARHFKDPIAVASVIGYIDPVYGRVGVEGAWDTELSGLAQRFTAVELQRIIKGEHPRGKDLVLTLDFHLQQAALRALGERQGAVVMLDPVTGGILALASSPTFDLSTLHAKFKTLKDRDDGVLRNRAAQDLYPPGSTMKVVTAAAALMHDVNPRTRYTCQGETPLDGTTITDYHGETHGSIDMPGALAHSCNYYFARTAFELGQESFFETAQNFGFNQRWWTKLTDPRQLPIQVAESTLEHELSHHLYTGEFAQMGFGQGSVVATPLQMAMVSAAIANNGKAMTPYLVSQVRLGGTTTALVNFQPVAMGYPMDEEHAQTLTAMMRRVVTSGTAAGKVNVSGLTVYGKTGTAQQNGGDDHAWFMGFAEIPQGETMKRVAFAVVIERGGTGGVVAAPVARQVLETWRDEQQEASTSASRN